jgi:alpha-N-arabinofuranosidase
MQGTSLSIHVSGDASDAYSGPTVPAFVHNLMVHTPDSSKLTKWVDVSGVLSPDGKEVRLAIVNRNASEAFSIPILFGPDARVATTVKVYEVWSPDVRDRNGFEGEKVKTVESTIQDWQGVLEIKKHSFQGVFK